tara:strand:- start:574 stop:1074 length:501 start_codon:yes stop_codon:yes gene_type:complete
MDSTDNKEKKQVCKEYNALKYKTMIMTGTNIEKKITNETNEQEINDFLMNEMIHNKKQSWNKLSKTEKIKKLNHYISHNLNEKHDLNTTEKQQIKAYVISLLDRKKLIKNSDVNYDEETGEIVEIYALEFNESSRKFTLNNKKPETKKTSKKTTKKNTKPKPKKID